MHPGGRSAARGTNCGPRACRDADRPPDEPERFDSAAGVGGVEWRRAGAADFVFRWTRVRYLAAGQFSPLSLTGATVPLALSDDAATLVFIRLRIGSTESGVSLIARNLPSGSETTLYTSDTLLPVPNFLGMTNDGKQVLYNFWGEDQNAGTAYLSNTSSGVSTALVLDSGELATTGTLSGSGNATYLATLRGRIVKFLLSGGIPGPPATVVPKTPYIDPTFLYPGGLAPGSMVRLHGVLPDSVEELSGHLLLDGNPIPVLYASSSEVRVQIPWAVRQDHPKRSRKQSHRSLGFHQTVTRRR